MDRPLTTLPLGVTTPTTIMPEVYRESRYVRERERDTSPSDDEGYKRTTVRRYKVTPDRVERVEREVDVVEEERRSRYAPIRRSSRDEVIEVDRRVDRLYIPERPRSSFDPSPHSATYVDRQVIEREREREPRDEHYTRVDRVEYRGDGARGAVVERERVVERDEQYPPERTRTVVEREIVERDRDDDYYRGNDRDRGRVVYESTKEVERVDRKDAYSPREWERRSYWDDEKDAEVRIEKRVEHRDGGEVRVERRVEERRDDSYPGGGADVERWRKETEYYEPVPPPPAPIVIRQRAPEQKIILQEAPPATVVIRGQTPDPRDITVARRGSRDGEYYYHRESREIAPYRGERREEELAIGRYDDDRHRHHHHHHHRRHHHGAYSDAESDDGYYMKRTVRRERSASSSPHRKRHIAEGALAGAGISAILASRRDSNGEYRQNRGRKVLAGAAIGALGTEVARRAHSAYQERYGDDDERERSRSRSRPPHSKLKTGLGIAAVALAAAGAAKYLQSNKIEKEEMTRGRALHRDSDSDRSPSRKRSKSRAASLAKAGLGTAAAVGLVQHYRHKSKSRDGKSRSRSRLRTGAEILAAGLAGAGAKKLYDRRKDKKEAEHEQDRERERELSDDEYYERDARDYNRRSRSRSLTRSGPTYPDGDSSLADPELGMVEYGAHPLYAEPPYPVHGNERGEAAAGYESAAEDRSRRRRRSHGGRSRGDDDYPADSEAETDREKRAGKKRSGSRLRDLAAGAAAAGAAAIGIKKFNEKKDKGKEKDERDRERDRERNRERERERGKERDRRRKCSLKDNVLVWFGFADGCTGYEDDDVADAYDNYPRRGASPPHASGGFYNPPPAAAQAPPAPANGFTQHPNVATTNLHQQYPPYPPDSAYQAYTPPMPSAPPNTAVPMGQAPPPPGYIPPPTGPVPPPANPTGPEHVSEASRVGRSTPEPEAAVRSVDGDKKGASSLGGAP